MSIPRMLLSFRCFSARLLLPLIFVLCLATIVGETYGADETLPPKERFHLYLLIGQSNMAGRGVLEKKGEPIHPRVLMFTKGKTWAPGAEPLHFDKVEIAGAGMGSSFAQVMAEANPEVTIGLVPCAVGGTPLSRWQKEGDLYEQALVRIRAAMQDGAIKGVLWHQGESDAGDPKLAHSYAERLAKMIADLRADLEAPDLPFVAGKLGEFLPEKTRQGNPNLWKEVNEQLASLPKLVSHVAVVESAGLVHKGDSVHFDTASLRTFGERYAEAMKDLQSKASAAAPNGNNSPDRLLGLTAEFAEDLKRAEEAGVLEISPVNLPPADAGDCNHFGWPIATRTGETLVVMHRRIPGHNPRGAGGPDPTMSYGIVLTSDDGGKIWSAPYDLRDCMLPEDRERGGLVPLSHRAKFDPENKSTLGYKVHLHSIGTTHDGAVVAINNHGVFRSEDAGRTWQHFSTTLREDTFSHPLINIGPRILDLPGVGLVVFGNWFGKNESQLKKEGLPQQFVALISADGGATWKVEEHAVGFPQFEPAALEYEGNVLLVARDQSEVRSHKQMSWRPGQRPQIIDTNLEDPRLVDTVDLGFNPVTRRLELVRSERHRMELWLWSMDPADWEKGVWTRECQLLAIEGKFYSTADGFHPAGAVIDAEHGVQHIFVYAGHPNGPAGVFRITRSLETPGLRAALRQ